jgi:large repetitive protein
MDAVGPRKPFTHWRKIFMNRTWIAPFFAMSLGFTVAHGATISGIVTNAGSTPLAGIDIAFQTTLLPWIKTLTKDITDSSGLYSVKCDSTSGTYVVRSTDPERIYATKYDTVVLDGTDKTVNVQMTVVQYCKVFGTVKDSATDKSIVGAIVMLETIGNCSTDSSGTYFFDSIATGTYLVSVIASGYVGKTHRITTSGADPLTVDFKLSKIQYSKVTGTVKDSTSDNTIVGAIVWLGAKWDTTDISGTYFFDSVAPGTNMVSVTVTGYVKKSSTITTSGTNLLTVDFKLCKIQYSMVTGMVKDSTTSNSIAGASVMLLSEMSSFRIDSTDADGKFAFDSVSTGPYTISVWKTGYVSKSILDTVLATAQTLEIKLSPIQYSSVSGKVIDSATGMALAGASVGIGPVYTTAAFKIDTTDTEGKYALDSVATGVYSIRVTKMYYVTKSITDTVTSTAHTLDIILSPSILGSVSGKVTDSATGNAISGAIISLDTGPGIGIEPNIDTTNAEGYYSFENIATRTTAFKLSASAIGHQTKSDTVFITDTTAKTKDFTLGPTVYFSVSGIISNSATGSPVRGVEVLLGTLARDTLKIVVTDSTGAYTIDSAYTGTALTVSAMGYSTMFFRLTGTTTDTQKLNFLLTDLVEVRTAFKFQQRQNVVIVGGKLTLKNFSDAGTIRLFNLKGELVFARSFTPCVASSIQLDKAVSRGNYLIKIAQKNLVLYRNTIIR